MLDRGRPLGANERVSTAGEKIAETLSDYRAFLTEFVRNYRTTGAIVPSGRALATALSRYVGQGQAGQRILEAGPGTGAVTSKLIDRMRADDELWLVETNASFVSCLRDSFGQRPNFRAAADRCHLVEGRLQDLQQTGQFDVIVSGLPLNNFSPDDVRNILQACSRLLRPAGILSFYEYIFVRPAKMMLSAPEERKRLKAVGEVLRGTLAGYEIDRELVLPNVPPACVHHVCLGLTRGQHPCSPRPS